MNWNEFKKTIIEYYRMQSVKEWSIDELLHSSKMFILTSLAINLVIIIVMLDFFGIKETYILKTDVITQAVFLIFIPFINISTTLIQYDFLKEFKRRINGE